MKLNEGVIIKSLKYQESSKIITILTNEGLSSYYVKGGAKYKSKNFSYSNELTKIAFDFSQKNNDSLKILTTGTILNNFSNIKQSFEKLNDCFLLLELIDSLGNQITDYQILYDFVNEILTLIDEEEYSPFFIIIFRLKLLYLLGVGPIFSRCVSCSKKEDLIGFVFEFGGMCCKKCVDGMSVLSKELTEIIKYLYLTKLENVDMNLVNEFRKDINLLIKFIDSYYENFLGFKSKAKKVLDSMKN